MVKLCPDRPSVSREIEALRARHVGEPVTYGPGWAVMAALRLRAIEGSRMEEGLLEARTASGEDVKGSVVERGGLEVREYARFRGVEGGEGDEGNFVEGWVGSAEEELLGSSSWRRSLRGKIGSSRTP